MTELVAVGFLFIFTRSSIIYIQNLKCNGEKGIFYLILVGYLSSSLTLSVKNKGGKSLLNMRKSWKLRVDDGRP